MAASGVVGGKAMSAAERCFVADMRAAGRVVNWFTFLDGREAPSVCGVRAALQPLTQVLLQSRPLGSSMEIVWPAADATCPERAPPVPPPGRWPPAA